MLDVEQHTFSGLSEPRAENFRVAVSPVRPATPTELAWLVDRKSSRQEGVVVVGESRVVADFSISEFALGQSWCDLGG
ncbi:hypothetical protein ACFROC_04930 [Nocardia tengchongensis]|uniref:hypothetical protein n=1 Tax=Nocardia tengchongensis TaxID=2055889 RepID=UPI00369B39B7